MSDIKPEDYSTSGLVEPAADAIAVTPADTDLAHRTRGIYIGIAGDLVVKMANGGNTVVFNNVVAGSLLPLRVTQVKAATTALSIVAVF